MITPTQMYWLTRLDAIDELFFFNGFVFFILSVVLGIIGLVLRTDYGYEERGYATGKRLHHKWMPLCMAVSFVSALVSSFIPSTKEMAAIIVIPKIANSEKVQDVGNRLYDLAVEWAEELHPKKKEDKEAGNIANSEKVQDVGNRLYAHAVEWTEELYPKKKEVKEAGNAVR